MGNVEKYGLLALFVLCALIVGVGVFGEDGTDNNGWKPTVGDNEKARTASSEDWNSVVRAAPKSDRDPSAGQASRSGRLVPVPEAGRDRSFPKDLELWSDPDKIENGKPGGRRSASDVEPGRKPRKPPELKSNRKSTPKEKPQTSKGGSAIVVRPGDSFEKIARRELGSRRYVDALMAANPGTPPLALRPGQKLKRPSAKLLAQPAKVSSERTYRVRSGDSLQRISKRFYKTTRFARYLAEANDMRRDDVLRIGRVLRIPPVPSK